MPAGNTKAYKQYEVALTRRQLFGIIISHTFHVSFNHVIVVDHRVRCRQENEAKISISS